MKAESVIRGMGIQTRDYMNEVQVAYFKNKLSSSKVDLLEKISRHREKIKTLKTNHADVLDRSLYTMDLEQEIRIYERYSQVLRQIDDALERISAGRFGYCEFSGRPIGLERLEALPFANLSIEALEELESGYCQ
jgi:DnaK suppressor protein